ncbi:protein mono-ADP-ribosyltransferase PARP4 isoform X2 [Xenopus laevis]|uniref:Poly [ADP-ribose] polymerase n=1 Tax=Xenopus laevis TaxID=8355 RepID=A0A8J1MAJ2_XENLA|nr:protein mono-ADP-ribosyltransferase PARP4 isoform X2 [Xenopus laevis]
MQLAHYMMTMGVFEDCVFFLKVTNLSIKEKEALHSSITSNGGGVSFILNHKCTHVLVDTTGSLSDSQLKTVQKHQILIVEADYVGECIEKQSLIKNYQYPKGVPPSEKQAQMMQDHKNTLYTIPSSRENKNNIQDRDHWNDDENNITDPPNAEMVKYCFLQKGSQVAVFELLRFPESSSFRICTIVCHLNGSERDCCFQFADNIELACHKYERRIEELKKDGYKVMKRIPKDIIKSLSETLQKVLIEDNIILPKMSLEVKYFVETVWTEALSHMEKILSCPVNSINLMDVNKAEGVLLYVRKLLDTGTESAEIKKVMAEFYQLIPHKEPVLANIDVKLLLIKMDLCQLIRDIVNVCEINFGDLNPSSFAKYRALQCRIEHIDPESEEFLQVSQQILKNQHGEEMIKIINLFHISKPSEAVEFERNLGNIRSLIHASSPHSFVGILYRGLLLPKFIEDDSGLLRTDSGNHGSGIYFSNSISSSVKYAEPSITNGARLLVVCDVALGNCKNVYKRDFSLTAASSGFHSVQSVRQIPYARIDFKDEEFLVYKKDQVRMRYVVQFCTDKDTVNMEHNKLPMELENIEEDGEREQVQSDDEEEKVQSDDEEEKVQSDDEGEKVQSDDDGEQVQSDDESENEPPMKSIIHGLQSIDGKQIPQDSVHVKAKIIDIAAEVTLFQTYVSHSTDPIEAKYVSPLDSNATVCGFEAFINGRHFIGEVKEKERSHEEYRAAISEGHGVYFMEEEADGIFSVSLATLPPEATVIIKVTYLTVLSRDQDSLPVRFLIPPTVTSWETNEKEYTQYEGVENLAPEGCFSLDLSIEMPCKIESFYCKTHLIKVKKTDRKAVITSKDIDMNSTGFCLDITLEEYSFPRLWVEKHPDEDSEACMLVFHSSLEDTFDKWNVTICLDCSNSMESCFETAKQIALTAARNLLVYHKLNVVLFGTNYMELYAYTKSHHYEQLELQEFINLAKPNMGSTELWKFLQALTLQPPSTGMHKILLISDGHIQNESLVFKILNQNAGKMSIYGCAVGATANRHMLSSLSQQSHGTCEYFEDATILETKVSLQTLRICLSSCQDISVKWQQANENYPKPVQAPAHIAPLFPYKHLLVFAFVPDCTQVTFKALCKDQELDTVVSDGELQKTTGTMLHRMTARAIISDCEGGILHLKEHEHEMKKQQLKPFIIGLSKKYSIVSQFTSFVAGEKQDEQGNQENWVQKVLEMISAINVDILPHMDWDRKKQKTPWQKTIRYRNIMWRAGYFRTDEERPGSCDHSSDGEEGSDPVTPHTAHEDPTAPKTSSLSHKEGKCPSFSSLSALQCEEGYWQLNEALGSLININVNYLCNDFLVKNGIQSLGRKGKEEIPKLIATLLVLQVIRTNNLQGIKCRTLMSLDESSCASHFQQTTEKAMEWVKKRDNQYPGICYRLGLGKDWESATRKLLSIDPVDPSSDLYPALTSDTTNI